MMTARDFDLNVDLIMTRFGINTAPSVAAGVSSTADRTWSIRVMQVKLSLCSNFNLCDCHRCHDFDKVDDDIDDCADSLLESSHGPSAMQTISHRNFRHCAGSILLTMMMTGTSRDVGMLYCEQSCVVSACICLSLGSRLIENLSVCLMNFCELCVLLLVAFILVGMRS